MHTRVAIAVIVCGVTWVLARLPKTNQRNQSKPAVRAQVKDTSSKPLSQTCSSQVHAEHQQLQVQQVAQISRLEVALITIVLSALTYGVLHTVQFKTLLQLLQQCLLHSVQWTRAWNGHKAPQLSLDIVVGCLLGVAGTLLLRGVLILTQAEEDAAAVSTGQVIDNAATQGRTAPHNVASALQHLNGVWLKDVRASDSMEPAMNAVALNGLMRQAVRLIKGMEVQIEDDRFHMAMLTVFSWYKVRESYSMDGVEAAHKRRDLRRGQHQGSVTVEGSELVLHLRWAEPHAGEEWDRFTSPEPGKLLVHAHMVMADGTDIKHTSVYYRKE